MTAAAVGGDRGGMEALLAAASTAPGRVLAVGFRAARLLVLWHPEDIRHVLVGNSGNYSKETGPTRMFREHVADGILSAPEQRWRAERSMLHAAMRDTAVIEQVAARHARRLVADLGARAGAGEAVDLTATMSRLALGIGVDALFGWQLDDELAAVTRAAMDTRDVSRGLLPAPDVLAADGVLDRLFEVVADRIARQPIATRGPVLRVMFEENIPFDRIVHQSVTLLVAGHETTASSLAWVWIEMCRNPIEYTRWQQRMRERPAEARSVSRAIFEETLRLWPPAWAMGRRAESEDRIGDHRVAAGTDVMICSYLTHRRPEIWPAPAVFDPDRVRAGGQFEYFPFGGGHRRCLGQVFALREAEIVLTELGRRFRFRSAAAASATPRFQFTLRAPALPVEVVPLSG